MRLFKADKLGKSVNRRGVRWVMLVISSAALLSSAAEQSHADQNDVFRLTTLSPPVGTNAREPSLSRFEDGRIVLSWTEESGDAPSVRMAVLDRETWSPAHTIYSSEKIFVNWADFPSVVVLSDGTLAAHWLQLNGPGDYQYDVNIAFSADEGKNWTQPILAHEDRSRREHGFASLIPDTHGGVTAIWLDGRNYDSQSGDDSFENSMQVRARRITPDGTMGPESLLDQRACTCCQTSAVRNAAGEVIAAYRDRTAEEIRDIAIVRLTETGWTPPEIIHDDGWEIAGCPVNGPAVDALGNDAVVLWFTGADAEAKVRIAFSEDGGATFKAPLPLDLGASAGRVDVLLLRDGTAMALWIEYLNGSETIVMCRISAESGCRSPQALYINQGNGSVGFPRMTRSSEGFVVAWTAVADAGFGTTVRILKVDLPLKVR